MRKENIPFIFKYLLRWVPGLRIDEEVTPGPGPGPTPASGLQVGDILYSFYFNTDIEPDFSKFDWSQAIQGDSGMMYMSFIPVIEATSTEGEYDVGLAVGRYVEGQVIEGGIVVPATGYMLVLFAASAGEGYHQNGIIYADENAWAFIHDAGGSISDEPGWQDELVSYFNLRIDGSELIVNHLVYTDAISSYVAAIPFVRPEIVPASQVEDPIEYPGIFCDITKEPDFEIIKRLNLTPDEDHNGLLTYNLITFSDSIESEDPDRTGHLSVLYAASGTDVSGEGLVILDGDGWGIQSPTHGMIYMNEALTKAQNEFYKQYAGIEDMFSAGWQVKDCIDGSAAYIECNERGVWSIAGDYTSDGRLYVINVKAKEFLDGCISLYPYEVNTHPAAVSYKPVIKTISESTDPDTGNVVLTAQGDNLDSGKIRIEADIFLDGSSSKAFSMENEHGDSPFSFVPTFRLNNEQSELYRQATHARGEFEIAYHVHQEIELK